MAVIKKNADGYGYKYTDLAKINEYIESTGCTYYQEIETYSADTDVSDYIVTVVINEKGEEQRIRGCRVPKATLSGKTNPAQEYGSAITYARRYSLLMAFGLATTDDDAECLTVNTISPVQATELKLLIEKAGGSIAKTLEKYKVGRIEELTEKDYEYIKEYAEKAINNDNQL